MTRTPLAFALALAAVAAAGDAHALDAYRDRRGLFTALLVDVGRATTGDTGDNFGGLGVRAGGGLSQSLTVDLTLKAHFGEGDDTQDLHVAVNLFPFAAGASPPAQHGPFLRAGGGGSHRGDELGFAAVAGAGFEALLTGDIAASLCASYEPAFFEGATRHRVLGTLALTWY